MMGSFDSFSVRKCGMCPYIKRIIDICGAIFGLLAMSPVLLVTAIGIRCSMGAPILFQQERPGKNGAPFFMLKFRTMTKVRDENGELLPDADRLTRIGRFLRKTSLDEFPEFINVLKGDMSLVGPRPLLMQYLPLYSQEQARRHDVRPGVTGWAQISGRNTLSWEEKFKLDVWYVDHCNLRLDMKIILLTIWTVIRRDGINADDHATMPEFGKETKLSALSVDAEIDTH
jgi:sugar transferase EpsL